MLAQAIVDRLVGIPSSQCTRNNRLGYHRRAPGLITLIFLRRPSK
jgi:hypothetical protein